MTKRDDFIAAAKAEVGTVEGPKNNETKYGKFTKHDLQPWCGSFIMWCANKVGVKIPNVVWTPGGMEAFKGSGKWSNGPTATPRAGDLAFFDFIPGGAKVEHVGIVIENNLDGTVTTVEGNTSPDSKPKGSQANGGEVCLKVRGYQSDNKRKLPVYIVGFGRPNFGK